MTYGIQPNILAEVGPIFAEFLGKDWERDRQDVVNLINELREMLYYDPDFPDMFDDKFYCMLLVCYPVDCLCCTSCGGDTYYGFTIPNDIEGIEQIWKENQPLRMHSRWWEAKTHIITRESSYSLTSTLVAETFATQRPLTKPSPIAFVAHCEQDEGKSVYVEGTNIFDEKVKVEFVLRHNIPVVADGECGEELFKSIQSVTAPKMSGQYTMLQADDHYEVSNYSGYEANERFRRVKVELPCDAEDCCKQVLIQGTHKFKPICFDSDVVEVGTRRILRHAAEMLRYGNNTLDGNEKAASQFSKQELVRMIKGAMERQRGSHDQDMGILTRKPSPVVKHGLHGYGARGRRKRPYARFVGNLGHRGGNK